MNIEVLRKEMEEYNEELIKMRRYLHENPELSYQEVNTAKYVADKLRSFGLEVREHVGGTGVVGLIRGKTGRMTIGLRADMDALPVEEQTGLPFASKNKGVMHACGHDSHTAMLLAAAYILSKHRDELDGNVKFLFQPAEEDGGRGGALPMIEDGALENPHVDHVFGLHVLGDFPAGTFAIRGGAIMAAPDGFKITVRGKGGHGSAPADAIDPIYIGSNIINALYGVRSRFIDQRKPVTISVCSVHSGTKDNIIPDNLEMLGTLRTLDEDLRAFIKKKIGDTAAGVAEAFGARAETEFIENAYPVTYNDPKITEEVRSVLESIKGMKVIETEPLMGGEDVSRFLQKAPGTYYFLGTRNEKKGIIYPNHSPRFTVDEDYLKYGALSHVLVAMHFAGKK
ncbi:carboxypeptidase CpsA [Thermoplasma sp.]|uniref:carboxypeptidase CpsA n=1 Tax=Thermoplasma sp. TaxID=1973142 RepID=UPI00262B37E4|nr:carboxypeptidase CpsA [Thermoplasma sp.]